MRFTRTILYGIFSLMLLIFFVIYRKDNMLQISVAFFALIWFVQVPGSLILILVESKTTNLLRIVLFGNVIGLAVVPLLYYALYFFNLRDSFVPAISCFNVVLGWMLMYGIKNKKITVQSSDRGMLSPVLLLLSIVMVICSIREFSQMLGWHFVFNSKHDTDAGILMSMVIGLKNYGYLVNMNYGSVAVNYHHFIYLVMALVMKTTHIAILPLYQVVFPLYIFFFLALSAFYLALTLKASQKVAVLAAVSLLLLDDFYLLNQLIKLVVKKQPFFTIESIEWLHNSPSIGISLMMLFVIIAELVRVEKEKIRNSIFLLLILSIGTLACYKISTWACLVAGMLAASVLTWKKNPKLAGLSLAAVFSGFIVNKFLSGVSQNHYSSDGMEVNLAYPLLRSEAIKKFLHIQQDVLSFHDLNVKIIAVLAALFVFYVAGIFGTRLFYFVKNFKGGIRSLNFSTATVIFSTMGGVVISFLVTPKIGQHNSLYFILTGMYLLSVVSLPGVCEYLNGSYARTGKMVVFVILVIEVGSGLLQVLQPFTNPVKSSSLSAEWFGAMDFVKNNTAPNSLLAYNRFRLKENYYKDDFDFVPVFAERPVVVGGKQYFPDYEMKKSNVDSLFSTTSPGALKRIIAESKIDYILFDKWNGGSMGVMDSSILLSVFTNAQIDIYRVKRN